MVDCPSKLSGILQTEAQGKQSAIFARDVTLSEQVAALLANSSDAASSAAEAFDTVVGIRLDLPS